jgi:spore coat protein U-like protein
VECIHRNGDITGYIVRYREADTQTAESLNVSLNSTGRREETLSGLSAATVYAIQVAAVNTAGVGTYSDTVKLLIPGMSLSTNPIHDPF